MDVPSNYPSPKRTSTVPQNRDMTAVQYMRSHDPSSLIGRFSDGSSSYDRSTAWDRSRYDANSTTSSRSSSVVNGLQLPSIRNIIPGCIPPLDSEKPASYNYSSSHGPSPGEVAYETSPASKRRRISEDGTTRPPHEQPYAVPRSQARHPRQSPPRFESYTSNQFSSSEYQNRRQSDSPYLESRSASSRPPATSPPFPGKMGAPYDPVSSEFRPVLPSLPPMAVIDGPQPPHDNMQDHARDSAHRAVYHQPYPSQWESGIPPPHVYHEPEYPYGMMSEGPYGNARMPLTERSPFTAGQLYNARDRHQLDLSGRPGDGIKQRKRRGNLPKETTDKLRAWFYQHLQHPYPTEDEKQDLMRNTGLQMNQISNWFINARRRQLPSLINQNRPTDGAISGTEHEHNKSEGSDDNLDDEEERSAEMHNSTKTYPSSVRAVPNYPFKAENS